MTLLARTLELAAEVEGLRRIGTPIHSAGIFSFLLAGTHPSDLGGLRVSADAQVLAVETGQPVPGLYAAGACASNIAQDGAGYSSGTCIGESTFFGRRAGCHAAIKSS